MTNDEKGERIKAIVGEFACEYWRTLGWQVGQFIPGADVGFPHLTPETVFEQAMEPQGWLIMARYGAGLNNAESGYVYEICQGVAEWLFAIPGTAMYTIPDFFYETDFGALWAAAFFRVQGDELITIAEAAEIAGVSVQALSARIDRGTLKAYINPLAPARQGRRMVRRGDL